MGGCAAALGRLAPLLLIAAAIVTAALCPWLACSYCGAPTYPEVTVWWGVIPGIFLIEGLTLPTKDMLSAATRWRDHALIQGFVFGAVPLVTVALCALLRALHWLPADLREGFLAFSAVPTTTSMCVMHTTLSGGNAALAAFNAVLSNALAIVVSPLILGLICEPGGSIDYLELTRSLVGKMLLPLLAGQALQPHLMPRWRGCSVRTNQLLIACLLLQIFSDVFHHGGALPAAVVARVLLLVVGLQASFLGAAWALGGLLALAAADRVAWLFTSTHKTVVLGLPLLRVVFASRSHAGLVVLLFPLISYHLLQLLVGLALARRLRPLTVAAVAEESKRAALSSPLAEG